jgi:hypothetical protein
MLLRHICRPAAAQKLEDALANCKTVITGNPSGASCEEYANDLMKLL